MTERRKSPGWFINWLGLALLAFSVFWTLLHLLTGVMMCPAYVTLAQALVAFTATALAALGAPKP